MISQQERQVEQPGTDSRGDEGPPIRYAAALLSLWMLSVLGFTAFLVTVFVRPASVLAVFALAVCLGAGLAGVPLMLYDALRSRGTPAGSGFRFDPLLTAVFLLVIYPIGLPVYAVNRVMGPYLAAIDVDPDDMDLGGELEFGIEDLTNPTAQGVPAWWPAATVLFLWLGVLMGDGFLVVSYAIGDTTILVSGILVAVVMRLVATPILWLDAYVVAKTGGFEPWEAVALAAVTTLLYPVAAVGYVPYRVLAAYG